MNRALKIIKIIKIIAESCLYILCLVWNLFSILFALKLLHTDTYESAGVLYLIVSISNILLATAGIFLCISKLSHDAETLHQILRAVGGDIFVKVIGCVLCICCGFGNLFVICAALIFLHHDATDTFFIFGFLAAVGIYPVMFISINNYWDLRIMQEMGNGQQDNVERSHD